MIETNVILDRLELIFPDNENISDLRRAYTDKDLSSIFKIIQTDIDTEDLRKLVIEDNTWKLWPLLNSYVDTEFVKAFKYLFVHEIEIVEDSIARGQLESKMWAVRELSNLDVDLGTVFLCAGWYGILATLIFESDVKVDKIRSFDIDSSCQDIAEIFNKRWRKDEWKFRAITDDVSNIDYNFHTYSVNRIDGTSCEMTDTPTTVINTSCEHIEHFDKWWNSIPDGMFVVLQNNNFVEHDDDTVHNTVDSIEKWIEKVNLTDLMYSGALALPKYTRYMVIGRK